MQENKNTLFNVLTGILLVCALAILGFLGYKLYSDNKPVTVPDFTNKSINETSEWCGQLSSKYACSFVYENSKTVDVNHIISQSVQAGDTLVDKITFTVCNELIKEIALPDISNMSRSDFAAWASSNKVSNVSYIEEENDTKEAGKIIRIEPNTGVYSDTALTVFVSKTKQDDSNNNNSDNKKTNSTDIVVKFGDFIGLSVSDFESKVKALGLKPNHNTDKDNTSSSIEKDLIVWHGSGTYVKDETINYGLSLGKSDSSSSDTSTDDLYVSKDKYVGKTESELVTIANNLGLKATHISDRDAYSDTVAKGSIVTHGYGQYEKNEAFNYGLSLGKKDSSSSDTTEDDLYVSKDKYVGKTESEFTTIANNLGLKPTHLSDRDAYSDTVAKGSIVTHGYGQYEKNEAFNYGLSLGKKDSSSSDTSEDDLYVSKDKYVGKSESEFISIANGLGLKPTHLSERDAYSDTIAKGSVVTHGYGQYEKNEAFNYGLSLGKKDSSSSDSPTPSTSTVSVSSFKGKAESELVNFINSNGLKGGNRSEAYSSEYKAGIIISNDTGDKKAGDSINYVVSKGPEPVKNAVLNSFADLASSWLSTGSYDGAAEKAKTYLSNAGFTNYTITDGKSKDDGAGVLLKVTVDGADHVSRKEYRTDAKIVVTICSGYE